MYLAVYPQLCSPHLKVAQVLPVVTLGKSFDHIEHWGLVQDARNNENNADEIILCYAAQDIIVLF